MELVACSVRLTQRGSRFSLPALPVTRIRVSYPDVTLRVFFVGGMASGGYEDVEGEGGVFLFKAEHWRRYDPPESLFFRCLPQSVNAVPRESCGLHGALVRFVEIMFNGHWGGSVNIDVDYYNMRNPDKIDRRYFTDVLKWEQATLVFNDLLDKKQKLKK